MTSLLEFINYGPALVLDAVTAASAGSYEVVVTNPFGSVTSAVATLKVLLPPTIITQPNPQTLPVMAMLNLALRRRNTPRLPMVFSGGLASCLVWLVGCVVMTGANPTVRTAMALVAALMALVTATE